MKSLYLYLLMMVPVYCCGQSITGKVVNEKNEPLTGITVSLTGTRLQTATDDKGMFTISVLPGSAELRFTAADMETVNYNFSGKRDLIIKMKKKDNKLDEVQIVAYGTSTQRYNLGSVTKVSADDIGKQAVSNPLEALQGRVPGLTISATSGLPGATFNVQIRGQNTLKSSSAQISPRDNPLFIIDGVPFAAQNANVNQFNSVAAPGDGSVFNNSYGGISPFNSLNPQDIESIEVLRDADATAIYGSRGGNGVILITTKKGRTGKTDFNLNVRNGVSFIGKTMPMMNTQQYLEMRKEAFANDGLIPNAILYDPGYAPDLTIFDQDRYTDWKKFMLGNTANNLNASAALSGGSATTQFRLGAGFNRDTYIFPGNFADNRVNFSSNLHHNSSDKKFSIDFTTNYSYDKNNSSGSPNVLSAFTLEPNSPDLLDNLGNPVFDYKGVILDGSYAGGNPFSYLKRKYAITNINLTSNLLVSYEIVKGLNLRTSLGYNTFRASEYSNTPKTTLSPNLSQISSASFGVNDLSSWIIEPQLEYRRSVGKHSFNVLTGGTFQRNSSDRTNITGTGYLDDALLGSIAGASTTNATDAFSEYRYSAVFARISYKYDSKLLFNINGRRDGSSRFGPDRQFGNFGSVGAGYIFSEESLIKDKLPFLSYGKIRGSYGITGSDAIDNYQYIPRWTTTRLPYGSSAGYTPVNLYNPLLSWASTRKLEFGLETGFLQDRILLSTAWFRNRTGNQLVTTQLPNQTGFSSVYENLGAVVQNTGWEIMLQTTPLKGSRFNWSSSINLTVPKNKLIAFPNIQNSTYATIYFVGKSVNTVTGFNYAGVNPQNGLFQFTGANGQLTSFPENASLGRLNDYGFIGNTDPRFYGGWLNSFSYQGFQLDVFFEFTKQLGVNYLAQVYSFLPGQEYNLPVALLDRWRVPGQQSAYQRLSTQYNDEYTAAANFLTSSGIYSDASFIRMKTATLSYNFPAALVGRLGMHGLRLYATGQNLLTITKYKGTDPETQNFYGVPPLKSISFGLNINL